ncbi:hypothetical protein pipiens_003964 [Culex pipiens pipiens]|uniref:Gustatory receptor n=1 Tax=Culex pipiens pipiens TaxID=38569 RepID=A0ABD1CQ70_CULPP
MDSLNNALRPVFVVFQLMGTFPVGGILQRSPIGLRFRWISVQFLFSLTLIVVGLVMSYIEFERLQRIGANAHNTVGTLFYVDTVLIMALLVNLARKWRPLALEWERVEREFLPKEAGEAKRSLRKTVWFTSGIMIVCGLLDVLLSKTADVINQSHEAKFCNWEIKSFAHYFASRHYSFIFKHIPYNIPVLAFFEYYNAALSMAWTCQDFLIIAISMALSHRFRQIYAQIQPFSSGIVIAAEKFWSDIRAQHSLLGQLVRDSNRLLAPLIITSCGTNLYLLCFLLLNISKKQESLAFSVNLWFSLSYLILRTTLVFYHTAMVNETARAPLVICRRIPNIGWCLELERLVDQLRNERVSLSGMGFFHLTKRTMLAMAGTVVTYELVMLKFAKDTAGIGDVKPCSRLAFSKDT